jgi:light-regulated signal transduction histidine kinase (bacteriophytochrome)
MKYADKLFSAFQRLHSAQEFEGTGIGLATVARIVRRHSGEIWADAQPNGGAIIYFSLPNAD